MKIRSARLAGPPRCPASPSLLPRGHRPISLRRQTVAATVPHFPPIGVSANGTRPFAATPRRARRNPLRPLVHFPRPHELLPSRHSTYESLERPWPRSSPQANFPWKKENHKNYRRERCTTAPRHIASKFLSPVVFALRTLPLR